jgi:hypothetical protein
MESVSGMLAKPSTSFTSNSSLDTLIPAPTWHHGGSLLSGFLAEKILASFPSPKRVA